MHPPRISSSSSTPNHVQDSYIPLRDTPAETPEQKTCNTTIVQIAKVTFGTATAAGMGVVSWNAAVILNDPSPTSKENFSFEVVGFLLLATAFMVVGIAAHCFKLPKNTPHPPSSFTPGPFVLLTAACIGYSIGVKQQQQAAIPIWNNLTAENSIIKASNKEMFASYKEQVSTCYNDVDVNAEKFTKSNCTICLDTYTTTLDIDEYYLSQIDVVHFNQTLCQYPDDGLSYYWPNFATYDASQTKGTWPCGFPKNIFSPTATADRTILNAYLALYPPFNIVVEPIKNTSCYNAWGYGIRPYFPLTYCKGLVPTPFPGIQFTCLTNEFFQFINNYTATFKPYLPQPENAIPGNAIELADGHLARNVYIICSVLGGLSFIAAIPLEFRPCFKKNDEQKPLITAC